MSKTLSIEIRSINETDLPLLAEFLTRIYKFDPSENHFDEGMLAWKYLWPSSGWQGSCSYVLEKEGRIIAHCGLLPVTFRFPSGESIQGLTTLDWAADPCVPGAGISLIRKLMTLVPVSFIVGGAPDTRQIVPRIGFQHIGEACIYSAYPRPWHEFCSRPPTGRSILRLFHGLSHPVREHQRFGGKWNFAPVAEFDNSLDSILTPYRSWTQCQRTIAYLNHLLQCPSLRTTGFLLLRNEEIGGYLIVGRSGWEARVLDLFVGSDNLQDWKAACEVMTKAVRLDREVCRIRVQSTIPVVNEALVSNGYWCQYKEPIFIHDPSGALDRAFPLGFQLCDGDAGY